MRSTLIECLNCRRLTSPWCEYAADVDVAWLAGDAPCCWDGDESGAAGGDGGEGAAADGVVGEVSETTPLFDGVTTSVSYGLDFHSVDKV